MNHGLELRFEHSYGHLNANPPVPPKGHLFRRSRAGCLPSDDSSRGHRQAHPACTPYETRYPWHTAAEKPAESHHRRGGVLAVAMSNARFPGVC